MNAFGCKPLWMQSLNLRCAIEIMIFVTLVAWRVCVLYKTKNNELNRIAPLFFDTTTEITSLQYINCAHSLINGLRLIWSEIR